MIKVAILISFFADVETSWININIATFIMLFHYFFTLYLSLVYPVNHFYVFPVLQKSLTKRSRSNVKFSLYLKKAGLASRNIVRT